MRPTDTGARKPFTVHHQSLAHRVWMSRASNLSMSFVALDCGIHESVAVGIMQEYHRGVLRKPTDAEVEEMPLDVATGASLGIVRRQSGRVRRRMTVYLSPELAAALTARCGAEGREVSAAVAEAVSRWLAHG